MVKPADSLARNEPMDFSEVLAKELQLIRQRLEHLQGSHFAPIKGESPPARQQALELDLVGLALSGGGIRSATFNLGVIQGLAHLGLLGRFDYLSTVSGGGYIGTWLAAWIKREGSPKEVEQQLKPNREKQAQSERLLQKEKLVVEEEPEPVYHLRSYSNYLSPRLGLFSIDTWTLVSIYIRNFLLNLSVLVPMLLALVLTSRLLLCAFHCQQASEWVTVVLGTFAGLLLVLGFTALTADLRHRLRKASAQPAPDDDFVVNTLRHLLSWTLGEMLFWGATTPRERTARLMHLLVFWPLMLAAVILSWLFRKSFLDEIAGDYAQPIRGNPALFAGLFAAPIGLLVGAIRLVAGLRVVRQASPHTEPLSRRWRWRPDAALYSTLSGWLGCFLFFMAFAGWLWVLPTTHEAAFLPAAVLTIGPPLVLLLFFVGIASELGLHSRVLEEDAREWWGTVGGYFLIYASAWLAFFGITLYGGWLMDWIGSHWIKTGLAATWITTAIAGVLSGRSPLTRSGQGNKALEWIGIVAPPVFVVGLLIAVSLLANAIVEPAEGPYWQRVTEAPLWWVLIGIATSAFLAILFGACVDVNLFSLHGTYANRLIRCYLGASRRKAQWGKRDAEELGRPVKLPAGETPRRKGEKATLQQPIHGWLPGIGGAPTGNEEMRVFRSEKPADGPATEIKPRERQEDLITGFDPEDDILLTDLRIGKDHDTGEKTYWGPFLLINTALNLVAGDELAWQERKADSFVLSPLAGGSKSTGYRELPPFKRGDPEKGIAETGSVLTLGRAMGISGAAASPNMGYHTSPPLAFLMTVFNARLGWWMQNPRLPNWQAASPSRGNLILNELLGQTNEKGRYVYLSDGGHFENLGVYELVRRRSRFIVACDAGADPHYEFFDLGNLVRKCRNDFGIRIEIDASPIRPQESGRSRWHCAVGTIRYDDVDLDAVPGMLVYLKASLTGDEPSDVLAYADQHASFPHQSTVNQFFTESQFESYRALGFHVAEQTFGDAIKEPQIKVDRSQSVRPFDGSDKRLFSRIRRRWFPPPPNLETNFLESTRAFMHVEAELRRDANLRRFGFDLYPELGGPGTNGHGQKSDGQKHPTVATARPSNSVPELHAVCQMLQVMENAWLGLNLGKYHEHPLNRGWMNVFRRWTNSDAFSRHWPALRGQYSQEFVQFCEKELKLLLWRVYARRYEKGDPAQQARYAFRHLATEFAFEWHEERSQGRGLHVLWRRAKALTVELNTLLPMGTTQVNPFIWVLWVENASKDEWGDEAEGNVPFPCGIVFVFRRPPIKQDSKMSPIKKSARLDDFELFVWIVGPYRNQGIGRDCISGVLEEIWRELEKALAPRPFTLSVRYPAEDRPEADEPLERALWSNFFHYYDFHKTEAHRDRQNPEIILSCEWQQYMRRRTNQPMRRSRC